jgi:hypothetical protein
MKTSSTLKLFVKFANELKTSLQQNSYKYLIIYIEKLVNYTKDKFLIQIPFKCETLKEFIQISVESII